MEEKRRRPFEGLLRGIVRYIESKYLPEYTLEEAVDYLHGLGVDMREAVRAVLYLARNGRTGYLVNRLQGLRAELTERGVSLRGQSYRRLEWGGLLRHLKFDRDFFEDYPLRREYAPVRN